MLRGCEGMPMTLTGEGLLCNEDKTILLSFINNAMTRVTTLTHDKALLVRDNKTILFPLQLRGCIQLRF